MIRMQPRVNKKCHCKSWPQVSTFHSGRYPDVNVLERRTSMRQSTTKKFAEKRQGFLEQICLKGKEREAEQEIKD